MRPPGLILLALLAVFLAATGGARGQTGFPATGGPVEIEASGGVEWISTPDGKSGYYRARGNVVAHQDQLTVRADELTAFYREGAAGQAQEIHRLEAVGNVVVQDGATESTGDAAVYDLVARTVRITGRQVRLTDPAMVIIASQSLEFQEKGNLAIALGNATAVEQDRRLRADRLTAYLTKAGSGDSAGARSRVDHINATGNVLLSTPTEIIRADEGVYTVAAEQALLCGQVKISRGNSQLNGECAEVDLKNGRSLLKGRVNSLIIPKDTTK